jgi:hypothetical protein
MSKTTDPLRCDDFWLHYPAYTLFAGGLPVLYESPEAQYFPIFTDLDLVAQWIEEKKLVDAVTLPIVSHASLIEGLEFIRQIMPSARLTIDPCGNEKRKSIYLVIGDYLDRVTRT